MDLKSTMRRLAADTISVPILTASSSEISLRLRAATPSANSDRPNDISSEREGERDISERVRSTPKTRHWIGGFCRMKSKRMNGV